MKGQNFLLGVLGKSSQPKGKNPNPSAKIIRSKPGFTSKQQPESDDQQAKLPTGIVSKDKQKKKSSAVAQIQKLQKKIQEANQDIEQTQKKLDVDLFLKNQKKKQKQYAKDLDKEFQIQKQKRQQQLYKKYQKNEGQEGQSLIQTKNVKTELPLEIFKILQNEKTAISKSKTIMDGHHHKLENVVKHEKPIMSYEDICDEENRLLFNIDELERNNDKENRTVSVMSLRKIAENMLNVIYFPIDFSKSLLEPTQQYQTLMSCLALMPEHLSSKYYSSLTHDDNQYFMTKMFYNGQAKSILLSDLILTREFAHHHINLHSKMADNRSFGPTVIEKSFRKVSANFMSPQIRESMYTLFGVDVQVIGISNLNYRKENVEKLLKFFINTGQIIGFMNDQGHNANIYENRIYPLKSIDQVAILPQSELNEKKKKKKKHQSQAQQKTQLDHSQIQKKTHYTLLNPYKGLLLDPKNLNKFELLELFQKFNKVILIRDYPRTWSCKRIKLQLFSLGPLSLTNNQWTKNNQYNFFVSSPTNIRIVMRKLAVSNSESIVKNQQTKEEDFETNNLYGFMVFQCREGEDKITCMKLESLLTKTKSNDSLQYPSYTEVFNKGNYIIIPYSNKVTKSSYQYFHVDFFIQKSDSVQFGKAYIREWKWQNLSQPKVKEKTIQSLENKEYVQRVKTQEIDLPPIAQQKTRNLQEHLKSLQASNITIENNRKFEDILIPGKLTTFFINPLIQVKKELKAKTAKQKSTKVTKPVGNEDIEFLQKQESLKILLGYDILQGEDINRGLMNEYLQTDTQIFDFEHYGLGDDGLMSIMEVLALEPSIKKLNLADNGLADSSIAYLCYYLEKGNRTQLVELNVSDNGFGKVGMNSIKGLMAKFKNLHVIF